LPSRANATDLLLGEGFRGFFITQMTDEKCKEKVQSQQTKATAKWKSKNPEKLKAQKARWYLRYKGKYTRTEATKINKQAWKKQRKAEDPIFAMTERLRNRLYISLKKGGFKKNSPTEKMLGCTFKQFTKHIERQFSDGMSWSNRAEWHLDHIVPLSCATTIEGIEKLSHHKNIRPLWAADNLSKSNNLTLI
jgi:Uri superfamily endonuclease